MNILTLERWAQRELCLDADELFDLKLIPAFDVFISRLEIARRRGSTDPLRTVTSKSAGGNSRASTKRMLEQLEFTAPERRAMHRLMAGTPSGWPGLLRLYVTGKALTHEQRRYARRQLLTLQRPT